MRVNVVSHVLLAMSVIGVLFIGISAFSSFHNRSEGFAQGEAIDSAINQLSASDWATRKAAKERIIQIGEPAVRPLVAFLKDLIEHQHEKHSIGTTKEEFEQAVKRAEAIPDSDSSRKAEGG